MAEEKFKYKTEIIHIPDMPKLKFNHEHIKNMNKQLEYYFEKQSKIIQQSMYDNNPWTTLLSHSILPKKKKKVVG